MADLLKLDNNIVIAPMAGYSDVGFRSICCDFGSGATFTEMLSAQAMLYGNKKTQDMTFRYPTEKCVIAQIFGNDPIVMARAVGNPILDGFEGIDINMGCPAPKVVKNGEGSALLKNLPLAGRIIQACKKEAGRRPLSVKVRLGFNENNITEIAKMCEESGADFITVHGRTTKQMFAGEVDYDSIAKAKQSVSIPVFGNGNVTDKHSYEKMLSTGVDGIMIGRGVVGKPWLIADLLDKPYVISPIEAIKKHVEILRKYYPEQWIVLFMRKHFIAYASAFKGGAKSKIALSTSQSIDESLNILQELYNHFEI